VNVFIFSGFFLRDIFGLALVIPLFIITLVLIFICHVMHINILKDCEIIRLSETGEIDVRNFKRPEKRHQTTEKKAPRLTYKDEPKVIEAPPEYIEEKPPEQIIDEIPQPEYEEYIPTDNKPRMLDAPPGYE
jgi:hypothetical protein